MPAQVEVRPSKRLAIFCDGTWVGRETTVAGGPTSNIRLLAEMVGTVQYTDDVNAKSPANVHRIVPHGRKKEDKDVIAGYQEGVGLNRTFLEYIWDGATAGDIGDECINVYKFIVENYTEDHEIWLFGYSRGSFTVRCVAGMINNCGIIKRLTEYTREEVDTLCYEVFRTYRSTLPVDKPSSDECQRFRGDDTRVWQVDQPIRFMGLIDTVGALGIPKLNAGIGIDWSPFEFFDNHASTVIQHVYHAPALHDRLWVFQPCLIHPNPDKSKASKTKVQQMWFPGTHYDVGRMEFRFVRQTPTNSVERLLGWLPDLLSRTIHPNEVLSDAVLRWLITAVQDVDEKSKTPLMPATKKHIDILNRRLADQSRTDTGSGDIYGDLLNYAPAGIVLGSIERTFRFGTDLLNRVLPRLGDHIQELLGIKTVIGVLTATADRRIPGMATDVYPYKETQSIVLADGAEIAVNIAQAGNLQGENEWGKVRYPSQSYESFLLWQRVFGKQAVDETVVGQEDAEDGQDDL